MSLTKVKGKVLPLESQLSSTDNQIQVDDYHMTNSPYVSIRQFLTIKDGSVDASDALQQALNVSKNITIPCDYVIRLDKSGITFPSGASLAGETGSKPTIIINHNIVGSDQFLMLGFNTVQNLKFRYSKQVKALGTGESPIAFGALFSGSGFYSLYQNLDIGNSYYGFRLGGNTEGSSSKITMYNIIGCPLRRGLSLDRVLDVPRIQDIHFNYNYLSSETDYAYSNSVKQWIFDNGEAFHFGRCDFAALNRLFAFGYYRGVYVRAERYTGSADSIRFIDCEFDICLHPFWCQNFAGRLVIRGGKFTGNSDSTNGLIETSDGSYNIIYRTAPASTVEISGAVFNNYSRDVIRIGSDLTMTNCLIYRYGTDNQQRAAVAVIAATEICNINLHSVVLDGTNGGTQTRGISTDTTNTGTLTMSGGTSIQNHTLEGFRWTVGSVLMDNTVQFNTTSRTGMSFLTSSKYQYQSSSIPTAGTFFRGDIVWNTSPSAVAQATVAGYTILGWVRLTNTNTDSTNHVIGTDWNEIRTIVTPAAIAGYNGTTSARPTTASVGTQYFDTTLGKPIWLKTAPSTWVDSTGTTV